MYVYSVGRSLAQVEQGPSTCNVSRSLCRAFLLRSVCPPVRLTVKSYAVRWPARSQDQSLAKVT